MWRTRKGSELSPFCWIYFMFVCCMFVCFPGDAHVCINGGLSFFTTMLLLLVFWHILHAHIQIDLPFLSHVSTRLYYIFSFTPPDVCSSFFIDLISHFQHPSSLCFTLWYPATAFFRVWVPFGGLKERHVWFLPSFVSISLLHFVVTQLFVSLSASSPNWVMLLLQMAMCPRPLL